jgi:hypothetical protein
LLHDVGKNKKTRIWVTARDYEGKNVGINVLHKPIYISDSCVAEAVATWKSVKFSRNLGFQNILTEGDALEIILALQKYGNC